ncbi:hypothetical protein AOXY_G2468 [Acipenser oxyrinchus oxyrinchus]|uniref:MADF domain-containing protein n=1 Tax=Acipenser oxyrinchus oxyrinchus TaxID=40147 RepID=A0AAD8GIP5_ACIOX|nr:hypothetical protein AOXY_G2468 [Acipenser oxyrinchus oxyrinchus]
MRTLILVIGLVGLCSCLPVSEDHHIEERSASHEVWSFKIEKRMVEMWQEHPCLFDISDISYHDRSLKEQRWRDIALELQDFRFRPYPPPFNPSIPSYPSIPFNPSNPSQGNDLISLLTLLRLLPFLTPAPPRPAPPLPLLQLQLQFQLQLQEEVNAIGTV